MHTEDMNLYFSVASMPLLAISLMICVHCTAPVMVMKMFGFFDARVVMASVMVGAVMGSRSNSNSILSLFGELSITERMAPS
ncbi:MAG: hypothetical protein R2749_06585 [Acidimicrobiales bacterium]